MDLRLHFAERASGNDMPGDRLFDVVAEGDTVLHNFDILSASGGQNTATVVPINGVHVTDGFLTLVFRAEADYPSIAGIEVLCPGACPPPDTTPPPAPGNLTASVSARTSSSTGRRCPAIRAATTSIAARPRGGATPS